MTAPDPAAVPLPAAISVADLRSAFDNAPIGMAVLAPDGTATAVNDRLCRLLGRPAAQLLGRTLFTVTHPEDLPLARQQCALMTAGQAQVTAHECRFLLPGGTPIPVLVSTSRVPGTPARTAHLIMHIEDITDRKLLEATLTHQARHDPLTGLGNRTLLHAHLTAALTGQHPAHLDSLLVLDLDGFKAVNDTFGHGAGDQVLQTLADRLTALLRPTDLATRLGGDEFAVLCPDSDTIQAEKIADRLRAAAALPHTINGQQITLTAAVGIATRPRTPADATDDTALTDLLHAADTAMYAAKHAHQR